MEFVEVRDLAKYVGAVASVRGWVDSKRSHGKVAFIDLRDGTGLVQCVLVKKQVPAEVWDLFAELTQETSIRVTGEVRPEPRAPGGVELTVTHLSRIGTSAEYPIQPKEHG